MKQNATCEHLKHEWEIEELLGAIQYGGYTQLKLRCKLCNASIQGEVIT